MKSLKTTTLYSRLALITSVTLVVGYFVVYAAWTNLDLAQVQSGEKITSALMQNILNKINDIGTRTDGIYSNAGNIGIGTTGTIEKVRIALIGNANTKTGTSIFGSTGLTYLQFDTTTTNNEVGIFGGEGMGSLSSGIGFARESSGNWGMQLRFYTKPTAITTTNEVAERMRITGDGNVGIGTTTPTQRLDLGGGAIGDGNIGGSIKIGGGNFGSSGSCILSAYSDQSICPAGWTRLAPGLCAKCQ